MSLSKIKKTKLEIKQDKLITKWGKTKSKKARKKTKAKKKFIPYTKLLKDSRWIKRRNQILKKDEYKCVRCGSIERLVVHHIRYIKNKMPWDYPDSLLITLCNDCHKEDHLGTSYP